MGLANRSIIRSVKELMVFLLARLKLFETKIVETGNRRACRHWIESIWHWFIVSERKQRRNIWGDDDELHHLLRGSQKICVVNTREEDKFVGLIMKVFDFKTKINNIVFMRSVKVYTYIIYICKWHV